MTGYSVAVDFPTPGEIDDIVRVSGWFLDAAGRCADTVSFLIDGTGMYGATRMIRMDVAAVYPQHPLAGSSGFFGDLIVPVDKINQEFQLSIEFCVNEKTYRHHVGSFICRASKHSFNDPATKSFAYEDIVRRPDGSLEYAMAGARHFLRPGSVPTIRLLEGNTTHGYSAEMLRIIEDNAAGVVVDLGCGIRPESARFPNVALLDAVHFPHVEIVNLCSQLPFRDSSIDAIISNAVYEHLPDPFGMAAEINRVLKPGGVAHICTAFMQPFHGDPDHYFNMTLPGLKTVFSDFDIVADGVETFQRPSFGLQMQMEAVKPFFGIAEWNTLFADFNETINRNRDLLDYGSELAARMLAAGVFVTARKR